MKTEELELTYLAKSLPKGLASSKSKEIIDIYVPFSAVHPSLRIRKNGDVYEITKKQPISMSDISKQMENTIPLTKEEFQSLSKIMGKVVRKIRYFYSHEGRVAEVDVFQDNLKGLVLIDFEFKTEKDKASFKMPDFCLAEVTQETAIAGGMLCGKLYKDIEPALRKYNYNPLYM